MINNIYEFISELIKKGIPGIIITAVEKSGHGPLKVGSKMVVAADKTKKGTIGGGTLELIAEKKALELIEKKESQLVKYVLSKESEVIEANSDLEKTGMMCGGTAALFYEYISSGENIIIFGAGHIGNALLYHLEKLPYFTTVVDERPEFIDKISNANKKIVVNYKNITEVINKIENSFVVIATHSHDSDYKILKQIIESKKEVKYLGVIASRKKSALIIEMLKNETGLEIPDYIYTPIGLDIGGDSPDEIAISIIAEIQAIKYGKTSNNISFLKKAANLNSFKP